MNKVYISRNNSKLGGSIPSVNLPPIVTCRIDAPCRKDCYATHGHFIFPNVKNTLAQNLLVWNEDHKGFMLQVLAAAAPSKFFRWHASGDIPDSEYLEWMVKIAKVLSGTKFLCFTKKFELVDGYIKKNGIPPENLRIVYSAWGKFVPENPYNMPIAYVMLKKEECEIPSDAHVCPKYCGECVLGDSSCWHLHEGESVCFDQH